jgi:hypothetical protein
MNLKHNEIPFTSHVIGGFAHVYLVRSATPIHNTTQHVLKRIAVADEAMLVEVKKEVDIMVCIYGGLLQDICTGLMHAPSAFCEAIRTL